MYNFDANIIYTNVSLRLNNISGLITKKMKKKSRITVEQIYIDLQDKFSFSTKCMGRETFPVPNKREIRLKRKKRKKNVDYPPDRVRRAERQLSMGIGFQSVCIAPT